MPRNSVSFFSFVAFSTKLLSYSYGLGELITVSKTRNFGEALEPSSFCEPDFATQWFFEVDCHRFNNWF